MNDFPFTETELLRMERYLIHLSSNACFGSDSERIAAKAAMGSALFVLRMRFDSEPVFFTFAKEYFGIDAVEASELITQAVGDFDDGADTSNSPSAIDV